MSSNVSSFSVWTELSMFIRSLINFARITWFIKSLTRFARILLFIKLLIRFARTALFIKLLIKFARITFSNAPGKNKVRMTLKMALFSLYVGSFPWFIKVLKIVCFLWCPNYSQPGHLNTIDHQLKYYNGFKLTKTIVFGNNLFDSHCHKNYCSNHWIQFNIIYLRNDLTNRLVKISGKSQNLNFLYFSKVHFVSQ